jgi:hypothetical protein
MALASTSSFGATAAACRAHSGPARVPVVELYTSQGCSSCPPADAWLSTLPVADAAASAPGGVIPLAFHVTYWDAIGWKDRFAQAAFTQRQRDLAARPGNQQLTRGVYTPEVFVDGRELPAWSDAGRFDARIGAARALPAGADIDVTVGPGAAASPSTADRVTARVVWSVKPGVATARLYAALTRDGYATRVNAGENRGTSLRNDHVVRAWAGPYEGRGGEVVVSLAAPPEAPGAAAGPLRLVAFAEDAASGAVLQAVALPLARCDDRGTSGAGTPASNPIGGAPR